MGGGGTAISGRADTARGGTALQDSRLSGKGRWAQRCERPPGAGGSLDCCTTTITFFLKPVRRRHASGNATRLSAESGLCRRQGADGAYRGGQRRSAEKGLLHSPGQISAGGIEVCIWSWLYRRSTLSLDCTHAGR